jgi:5-formyltetrahydrofolate cyclo-ligase
MVDKHGVRERVWSLLDRHGQARFPGARGRIPNFRGAERAAELLAGEPEWVTARAMKSNPDAPQLPVRIRALEGGKALYAAVPRLRSAKPFLLLDPKRLSVAPRRAASIGGAAEHGRPVTVRQVRRLDMVVCGTVAVSRGGVRVGKGGGYSDLELALLVEVGRIDDRTVIATTVHSLQVLDEDLPETAHDFRVDLIVTPEEVIRVPRRRRKRPPGLLWDHLHPEKIDSIPVLRAMAHR